MKYLLEFYEYGKTSRWSKFKQNVKSKLGIDNSEHRQELEMIREIIRNITQKPDYIQHVKSVNKFGQGSVQGISAQIINHNITVSLGDEPMINIDGQILDLHNIEEEANNLYDSLVSLMKYKDSI
jgi:hypothetical protein